MAISDSTLDVAAVSRARALLASPRRLEPVWPILTAAALLALSALVFATAMIVSPPLVSHHTARTAPQ